MKYTNFLIAGLAMLAVSSCSSNDDPVDDQMSAKEAALRDATVAYVDNTVLPTYSDMADAAVELLDLCNAMQASYEAGNLTSAQVEAAGKAWKKSRKSWELSEAFLFGPAGNHNIDPHIDSWPLDKAAMDNLLADIRSGKKWSLENNGGYGLIGFHAIEYMLFQLTPDGNSSLVHSTAYTPEEMEYLCAVAEDLCQQCVCLEACWAGTDNISERKQEILEDADLDYGEEYGWEMKNAGSAGSHFKTYQEAAEEIIQGCIDIADEVGTVKIGRPHEGSTEEDRNYIESPYSLNSIEDFIDNIRSIENSYLGSGEASSLSSYFAGMDPGLDRRMRESLENSKRAIGAIPEPFAKNATGKEAAEAVRAVGTDLVNVLNEIHVALSKEQ